MKKNSLVAILIVVIVAAAGCSKFLEDLTNGDESPGLERTEWAYEMVQLTDLEDRGLDGSGTVVCIVDTGINFEHPDLHDAAQRLVLWHDFTDSASEEPVDENGHGTHVAGIITSKGEAFVASATGIELLIARVFDSDDSTTDNIVSEAVDWCSDNGAHIISLSLGGGRLPILGTDTEDAVNRAINQGIFVVAASGNHEGDHQDGEDVVSPANIELVIAVGAIDSEGMLAPFSHGGDNDGQPINPLDDREDPNRKPEVVAPGVEITSAWLEDRYVIANGTSQAVPFVTAILSLVLEHHSQLRGTGTSQTISDVKDQIMNTASPTGGQAEPHDHHYGYGIIQGDTLLSAL